MSSLPTLLIRGKLKSVDGTDLSQFVPYEYILDWFRARAALTGVENRVLILKSETASGKSTLLPPKLYEAFVLPGGGRGIICTQPRVLTAIENVKQMLDNYKFLRLEDNIGWSTKSDRMRPKRVGLLSATIGTLTAQLKSMTDEEIAARYKIIMIDETHERDLQTDMAMSMLKSMLMRMQGRVECPFVVLMSATFDPEGFLQYYGLGPSNFIWCVGEAAGFDKMWDWNQGRIVNDIGRGAATVVDKICTEGEDDPPDRGDVMIFLPGSVEFAEVAEALQKMNKARKHSYRLLMLNSEAQKKSTPDFRALSTPLAVLGVKRRVILTTNVAETGLTINSLKYVIDAGFSQEMEFNPVWQVSALLKKPAPESRIRQRMGRAGRKFRGVFYPLYPEYIYMRLPKLQLPQILTSDITPIILDIVYEQLRAKSLRGERAVFDPRAVDMVDVPSADALWWGMEQLFSAGFLVYGPPEWSGPGLEAALVGLERPPEPGNASEIGFSRTGALAACLSGQDLTLPALRMLFACAEWGAAMGDVISIIAYTALGPTQGMVSDGKGYPKVSVDGVKAAAKVVNWEMVYSVYALDAHMGKKDLCEKIRGMVGCHMIDAVFLFHAIRVKSALGVDALTAWCALANINIAFVTTFIDARDAIYDQLLGCGIEISGGVRMMDVPIDGLSEVVTRLKHVIYDAYRDNLIEYRDGAYRRGATTIVAFLDCGKISSFAQMPKYLVAQSFSGKRNRKSGALEILAVLPSVMDGFVAVDPEFLG